MRFWCFTQNSAILRFSVKLSLKTSTGVADVECGIGHCGEIDATEIVLDGEAVRVLRRFSRMPKWM